MFKAGVGHSEDVDSSDAADEVISQVRNAMGEAKPAAGLLYCSINSDHAKILSRINSAFPGIELIGCTSDGEASSARPFAEESVTFVAFASDTIAMKAGLGKDVSKDCDKSAMMASASAVAALGETPKLAISLVESYATNGAGFVRNLSAALGDGVPVVGGFSTDQLRLKDTRQFYKNEVLTDCAPTLVFGGPLRFSSSCGSGYAPIGKEGVVTSADGNIVRQIDMKPASEFYRRYLGDSMGDSAEYSDYPLMVRENDEEEHCIRSAIGVDGSEGSMMFLSEMRSGAKVRISEASRDMLIEGARKSVQRAFESYPGDEPSAALLFSCACRKRLLGTRTKEEIDIVKNVVSDSLPICGFYTYGEIGPARAGGRALFHNDSFVIAFIGER
ncbi:MAG: FIST C-terminal domain-containing protein [Nitrospinae bacterium]|nr:FIST C-terminal domain-containing protein [Nitrospinota bacterium]MBF0633582.1 FIST C-terminal domain-containing protein [Nitrospinota bacterium]